MTLFRSKFVALFTVTLLAACGGSPTDGGNDNGNDNGNGNGDDRVIKANPSFATDIQEIFTRKGCTGSSCHGAAGGQMGLSLGSSAATNYANLVNVASTSEPPFLRVEANDDVNSYIVIKVEGRQNVGARMPLGGANLDNIDLTNLKNWINTGALNN